MISRTESNKLEISKTIKDAELFSLDLGVIFFGEPFIGAQFEYWYRGDARAPEQIFKNGFTSWGANTNLISHVNGEAPSIYISTSVSKEVAATFPRNFELESPMTYLYAIKAQKNAVNVVEILQSGITCGDLDPEDYDIFLDEKEMAVPKKIQPNDIKGAWLIEQEKLYKKGSFSNYERYLQKPFIPNPYYNHRDYNHRAYQIWRTSKTLGHIFTGVAIAFDTMSLLQEFEESTQSGNYDNTFRESARITGGWSGAAALGYVFAKAGAVACAPFVPYGPPACSMISGIAGSILGYWGGSEIAMRNYDALSSAAVIEAQAASSIFYEEGLRFYNLRPKPDFENAQINFAIVTTLNKNHAHAEWYLGQCYRNLPNIPGHATLAESAYTRAIDNDPTYAGAHMSRGAIRFKLGNLKGSRDDFWKAIELNKKYCTDAFAYLSRVYNAMGDKTKAELFAVVPKEQAEAMAYFNKKGLTFYNPKPKWDYENAQVCFQAMTALDRNQYEAWWYIAMCHRNLHNYLLEADAFANSVKAKVDYSWGHFGWGIANNNLKKFDQAIANFTKANELDPHYSATLYFRSISYAELGNFPQALQDAQASSKKGYKPATERINVLEARKLKADEHYKVGYELYKKGNFIEAKEALDKSLQDFPGNPDALFQRGACYFRLNRPGDNDLALTDFNATLNFRKGDYWALYYRGQLRQRLKDYDNAMKDYKNVAELRPNEAAPHNGLATVYLELDRIAAALAHAEMAAKLDPRPYSLSLLEKAKAAHQVSADQNEEQAELASKLSDWMHRHPSSQDFIEFFEDNSFLMDDFDCANGAGSWEKVYNTDKWEDKAEGMYALIDYLANPKATIENIEKVREKAKEEAKLQNEYWLKEQEIKDRLEAFLNQPSYAFQDLAELYESMDSPNIDQSFASMFGEGSWQKSLAIAREHAGFANTTQDPEAWSSLMSLMTTLDVFLSDERMTPEEIKQFAKAEFERFKEMAMDLYQRELTIERIDNFLSGAITFKGLAEFYNSINNTKTEKWFTKLYGEGYWQRFLLEAQKNSHYPTISCGPHTCAGELFPITTLQAYLLSDEQMTKEEIDRLSESEQKRWVTITMGLRDAEYQQQRQQKKQARRSQAYATAMKFMAESSVRMNEWTAKDRAQTRALSEKVDASFKAREAQRIDVAQQIKDWKIQHEQETAGLLQATHRLYESARRNAINEANRGVYSSGLSMFEANRSSTSTHPVSSHSISSSSGNAGLVRRPITITQLPPLPSISPVNSSSTPIYVEIVPAPTKRYDCVRIPHGTPRQVYHYFRGGQLTGVLDTHGHAGLFCRPQGSNTNFKLASPNPNACSNGNPCYVNKLSFGSK